MAINAAAKLTIPPTPVTTAAMTPKINDVNSKI
jgi:hypothetical protein